jgi:TonB-linked SusC/RagA family outer membrane protein
MKTKLSGLLTLLLALVVQITFAQEQQQTVSGTVTDASGMPLPGVNVLIKGTTRGQQTDFDGNYAIEASNGDVLVFSYLGMRTVEVTFQDSPLINVVLEADAAQLEEVVITALGIRREEKSLPYASQTVNAEELNITEDTNIKTALAGKVAGVQINAQAGTKLGEAGKIRIRGGISLTSDADPLYVIDGVPTSDPNAIDMSNVATLNVLKGPNATALYGQRASNGVVQITTKRGAASDRLGIEITSSVTFDRVGDLPNYQNDYGQGYSSNDFGIFDFDGGYNFTTFRISGGPYPDWMQVFDGKRYFATNVYADESWGPRFDGEPYVPWYAYYRDSPYFGQTDVWEAHPDNIRDFYDTGTTFKNIVALSGGGEDYSARISFTNLDQSGIMPYSSHRKNFVTTSFDFNITDNFSIGTNINYSEGVVNGDFDDGYGNQTTGSLNAWFARNLDMKKFKELQGLTTEEGYLASWNNWGLDAWAAGEDIGMLDFKKTTFFFNPYDWLANYKNERTTTSLLGDVHASYTFLENFEATVQASRNERKIRRDFEVPYLIEFSSAPALFNEWVNSFGRLYQSITEDNYQALLRYNQDFEDFDVSALIGGNIRKDNYYFFQNDMSQTNSDSGGLILPDVYTYANSREALTATAFDRQKQVNSLYGNISLGYNDLLFVDASIRRDWSSALPSNNNGYTYPSVGGSFIFTELMNDSDILTFGKLRGGWAQVGDDVEALALNPVFPLGSDLYGDRILQYDRSRLIDPNVEPAINTSHEFGVDLRFLNNRVGFGATYYKENRKNEIIPITISSGTGYLDYLTNAGESEREGVELTLDADIIQTEDFRWNLLANWATNKSTIISLPGDLQSITGAGGSSDWAFVSVVHRLGQEWGQLRGTGFARDEEGNRIINPNGSYAYEADQSFGSILPDFTGGFVNTINYKNFTLTASVDFQKGGRFFSLTEQWGGYTGLLAETAGLNDRGVEKRDPVADGGGTRVTGVFADGSPADMYVETDVYWSRFFPNRIAEQYIHDADYIKLRDVSLTYRFPGSMVNNIFDSASLSVIGRNLWLIAVADDNVHRWDPSEMSHNWGENAQLPSVRSFGMNLKLTF